MAVDELVRVDFAYESCAERLGLCVCADAHQTYFQGTSKSGKYSFEILVPHCVPSDAVHGSISYHQYMDEDRIDAQIIGLQCLAIARDKLRAKELYVTSSLFDDGVDIGYKLQFASHADIVPHIESVSSCFPFHL